MKKDGRSKTSPKNGMSGGRPPLPERERLIRNIRRAKNKLFRAKDALKEYDYNNK